MAKAVRQIIKIDEDKCNGCGECVTACAEGALQIIDGKARMVSEHYCDGLGACLGECPQDAISFETREAQEFDEVATIEHLEKTGRSVEAHLAHMAEHAAGGSHKPHEHAHGGFVCPSARTIDRTKECTDNNSPTAQGAIKSELRQWPIKLYLVNPTSPFFQDTELLVAADCVPFAYGSLHADFLQGKVLVTGCPKFDDTELYLDKLTKILSANNIPKVTVLHMEVPCCTGIQRLVEAAAEASGKSIQIEAITISLEGKALTTATANC